MYVILQLYIIIELWIVLLYHLMSDLLGFIVDWITYFIQEGNLGGTLLIHGSVRDNLVAFK